MKKIFVLGDSISIHYGPFLEEILHGQERRQGQDCVQYTRKGGSKEALANLDNPSGANGGDSAMVLSYIEELAESGTLNWDYLLLNCGLHDIKTDPNIGECQVSIEDYQANLKRTVEIVQSHGVKILWVRTTPVVDHIHNLTGATFHRYAQDCEAYNEIADAVMAAANIACIDLYAFTRDCAAGNDESIYCDHVHFSEDVRALQAAYIYSCLQKYV